MLIRSIALSEQSSEAWKSIGGWFPRRERTTSEILDLYIRNRCHENKQPIINLGNTAFSPPEEELTSRGIAPEVLFNLGNNIRPLIRPGTTRRLLGNLLPPQPKENNIIPVRYWIKAPGSKGKGKTLEQGQRPPRIPTEWDLQTHVVGDEYRVITVDDKVVQVSQRFGNNENRSYRWIGVVASPDIVNQLARTAAQKLQGRNVLGWDIMHVVGMDKAFILEGNSCPGVNSNTASRIIGMIEPRSPENAL
jgi:hypothetical protein